MALKTIYTRFPTREKRSQFVADTFSKYLNDNVLDVGCYEAPLREILPHAAYTGIDISGKPDITLDLEKIDCLPFVDHSFSCVLCIDVLEHIDNLHTIFNELVRVSQHYIIISLPNCWHGARIRVGKGQGSIMHYGLPVVKPLDRHKWFFSFTEARNFIVTKADELNLTIEDMFITEKPRYKLQTFFRKLFYPGDRYYNRYSNQLWVVLKK